MSNPITLADIERQIVLHRQAIKDLCEVGIRLDEAAPTSGFAALQWLQNHGYGSRLDAQRLIVRVIRERRTGRVGQDESDTGSKSSGGDGR